MRPIVFAGLVAALSTANAWADSITLKEEVYVRGPRVLLGDIADVEGADAAFLRTIEITPAALPGGAKRLNSALVVSKIRSAGVDMDGVELGGRERVTARTLSLEITGGMIEEDLRRYIRDQMPWDPTPTIVEVAAIPYSYTVPEGQVDFRWRPSPDYAFLGQGSFRGEVLVDGEVQKSFFAKATIQTYDTVIVAMRSISRGELLTGHNTRLENRELSTLKRGAFFDLASLEGTVAKSSIYPGQVITSQKVKPRVLVKRNQIVPVETTMGALTIRSRVRALSDAAAGEAIACAHLQSRQEFVGVLRKDGVLVVE